MTRFTLYHTVTDTLGRVQGEIYTLDEQIHQDELQTLKMPISDVERAIKDYAERKRGW
jgi:gas vesicle protein